MTIRVYKPEHVNDLIPDKGSIRLWAVWEGTDGRHHEEAKEYARPAETAAFLGSSMPFTVYSKGKYPLLTDEYTEDPEQVLPGTLRFVRIEDLTYLHRYVDCQGTVYAVQWRSNLKGTDQVNTLNNQQLNMAPAGFQYVIKPCTFKYDALQLEPYEPETGKEQEA